MKGLPAAVLAGVLFVLAGCGGGGGAVPPGHGVTGTAQTVLVQERCDDGGDGGVMINGVCL